MSGIVGILHLDQSPVERDRLQGLTDFLTFRGPDAQQIWIDGAVGFGHTLLKTAVESATERQPFSLDGAIWIVADVRLDARADLIAKLEDQSHPNLTAAADVELLLRAYLVWGENCVDQLVGDFAFGIWDGPRKRLFCARDHLGIKPFYYTQKCSLVIFSNTLECIRQHPAVSDELNDLAILDFLLCSITRIWLRPHSPTSSVCHRRTRPPGRTQGNNQDVTGRCRLTHLYSCAGPKTIWIASRNYCDSALAIVSEPMTRGFS